MDQQQFRYMEKSVIIHRDEHGFGLRVGGQNPVFVDCVHENGAAWKAGVRKDDRIIKVNGTLVRALDHQIVVHMIQNCTKFVNLTLHSPTEPAIVQLTPDSLLTSTGANCNLQSTNIEPDGNLVISNNNNNNQTCNNTNGNINNIVCNRNNSIKVSSIQDRLHLNNQHHHAHHHHHHLNHLSHHNISNDLNWLSDISDDLFQDNQKSQQQIQQVAPNNNNNSNSDSITSGSPNSSIITQQQQQQYLPIGGVSKLIVSGPSPIITPAHSTTGSFGKPKLRHPRNNPSSTRDNPYYYYKTAPEKLATETSPTTSSAIGSLNQENSLNNSSSSKSSTLTSSLSINRSRSGSKMSTRSTGKFKSKKLRSRLVDDLKSLTITNSQATPSSLSTSPSSSDLSDCDDQSSSRLDCLAMNISNSSIGGLTANTSTGSLIPNIRNGRLKYTTRRFEIIRELIDTEKTHTERLKHLNDLLYKPIKAEGLLPVDQLKMVFSCHKALFKVHRKIYKILLAAQQNTSNPNQDPLVGKALVEIFEGELGKRLEKAASTFCVCQSTNAELLNRITRKDTKVGEFLAQVANQQMLGRLGIKDLLASCFQRLTKYPLLLENLLKATPIGPYGIHSKSLSEGSIATNLAHSIANSSIAEELVTPTKTAIDNDNESATLDSDKSSATDLLKQNQESANSIVISTTTETSDLHNITAPTSNNTLSTQATCPTSTQETRTATVTTTAPIETNTTTAILDEDYAYERLCISRALHQSRQIVLHVDEAVTKAIAHNKLREIWRKTDKHIQTDKKNKLPVIDIETQQMLHDGPLTLRFNRRSIEVHVLLLTQYLVILTREGQDKYKLKYFTADATSYSPIFLIDEDLATRDTATDENGFYVLCKKKKHARIYEFASQSPAERTRWKEKIHTAQKLCNKFASSADDDNTLTRYRELITLTTSSNTPNNIEHSPTNNNIIATLAQSSTSLNGGDQVGVSSATVSLAATADNLLLNKI